MEAVLVIIVVIIAVGFDFTNGFHDAANAISTSISTGALPPRLALIISAIMNLIGALLGVNVADTIAKKIVSFGDIPSIQIVIIILSALLGAISWNIITWYFGLPSSSSHSLIGGLVGGGLSASVFLHSIHIQWYNVLEKVVIPMLLSPIVGFALAFLIMTAILWIFRNSNPVKVFRRFRYAQIFSSSAIALGHGLQDAQKTMGVMFLTIVAVGWKTHDDPIPLWIKILSAGAIAAGTYTGGFRIIKTLGRKIIDLDSTRGFSAEIAGASILWVGSFVFSAPLSTTHSITSAIMGAGATKRLSAVRWGVAKNIVGAWVFTLPAAALIAALFYFLLNTTLYPFIN
jgi:PiT family inorganic phosphate transporter